MALRLAVVFVLLASCTSVRIIARDCVPGVRVELGVIVIESCDREPEKP